MKKISDCMKIYFLVIETCQVGKKKNTNYSKTISLSIKLLYFVQRVFFAALHPAAAL